MFESRAELLSSFASVCVCVLYVHVCVGDVAYTCVCVCTWKPEVDWIFPLDVCPSNQLSSEWKSQEETPSASHNVGYLLPWMETLALAS